uniref:NADH-ubiquinone oxidoreductase chain 6 n=1 Tax=Haliclystus antarcticus TaxID=654955 RepID=A0A173FZP3_HALAN|nr:NADH dehydrogenase subunit 6 [Haliclystus antarcticus]ANH09496.1 NADH dehydrogenase subunit 6 [Haliclystus antarcticus]
MVYFLTPLLLGILLTGSQVITSRNPVHSVFWLVLTFIQSAFIFITWGLDFIALMTIIVYVGAIAILFLFVILMLQLANTPTSNLAQTWPTLFFIATGVFLGGYLSQSFSSLPFPNNPLYPENLSAWSNVEAIGQTLYSTYPLLFVAAGFTLLVAMVGAMVLSKVTS